MFELKERDCLARVGIFHHRRGKMETPTLLPVINPNQIIITPKEMGRLFRAQGVITNAYIIYKSEKLRENAIKRGVQSLIDFDGLVMTDSGTFQSYVYGNVDVEPLEIVEFQKAIGSDIGTILDVFTMPYEPYEKAKNDADETVRRAKDASEIRGKMALACPIQGSTYIDLREYCAQELSKIECSVHPIGGVVPLMEEYRYREVAEIILAVKRKVNPSRAVHLFGAGHPMIFSLAVLLGVDLFDSSSYSKYAKDNRMMFADGTRRLDEMSELPCSCPVCGEYTLRELKSLGDDARIRKIAEHNLYISFSELRMIRQAISEGTLWEFAERRCSSHPNLLSALRVLRGHKVFLEKFESLSKRSAFFYTGSDSVHRPIVHRYEKRLFERYESPEAKVLIALPEGEKPYSKGYAEEIKSISEIADAHFVVNSFFGPVPIELDEIYPIAQSIISESLDDDARERKERMMERYVKTFDYQICLVWEGEKTIEDLEMLAKGKSRFDLDIARIKAVADFQFGKGSSGVLFDGKVELIKSKRTGKIRNVIVDGEHALSMRASDGFFTLKVAGARRLHSAFSSPKLRVVVSNESAEFNQEGKNVFARFVLDCDENLRPMDEVLVVNEDDDLVAIGRTLMIKEEMLAFNNGLAVKVREGVKSDHNL